MMPVQHQLSACSCHTVLSLPALKSKGAHMLQQDSKNYQEMQLQTSVRDIAPIQ